MRFVLGKKKPDGVYISTDESAANIGQNVSPDRQIVRGTTIAIENGLDYIR